MVYIDSVLENTDNIVENFLFDYILRRPQIQSVLLDLSTFILSQAIWDFDKKEIIQEIIWNGIVDSNEEIHTIISEYRKWKKIPKMYEVLLNFIQLEIHIPDQISTAFLMNNVLFEAEYIFNKICENMTIHFTNSIKKEILSKKSFRENFSFVYLDEPEKKDILQFIICYQYLYDEEDKINIKKLNDYIENNQNKTNKILHIK